MLIDNKNILLDHQYYTEISNDIKYLHYEPSIYSKQEVDNDFITKDGEKTSEKIKLKIIIKLF